VGRLGGDPLKLIGEEQLGLQGILETFALADVLRLLAAARRTGCLHVNGHRSQGSVWLQQGLLIEAMVDGHAAGAQPWSEVLFELLRVERGSFEFVAADYPEADVRESVDLEATLAHAIQLLTEWHELTAVVPSTNHRVAIVPELRSDRVTLDAGLWTVLAAIVDRPTIVDVARRLAVGELSATRAICELVDLGVAVIESPESLNLSLGSSRQVDQPQGLPLAVVGEPPVGGCATG
jgi:hypothetical protein